MLTITRANNSLQFFHKYLLAGLLVLCCQLATAQYDTLLPPPQEEINDVKIDVKPADEYSDDTYQEEKDFQYTAEYEKMRFQQRKLPPNALKEMQDDEDFWYANAEVEQNKNTITIVPPRDAKKGQGEKRQVEQRQVQPNEPDEPATTYKPISSQSWFQTLMWIIIVGGFAGAIMWYLANSNVGLFRKRDKVVAAGDEDEEMPEDIFAINYQKEIDKAAAQGNYRLAIRLMYLRLLKNLSERNIIQYKQDRTNFDYLVQLHQTTHYKNFFQVTRHYEYSWYGKFDVSSDAYSIIRSEFDNFQKVTG